MGLKLIGLSVILAGFVALSAYAVQQQGYLAFIDAFFGDAIGLQVFFDLCIALGIVAVWMWRDAKERGISPLPYIALMVPLGSIGALAYLVRRELPAARPAIDPRLAHR